MMKKTNAYELWQDIEKYVKFKGEPGYFKNVYRNKHMDLFFQTSSFGEMKIYIHFVEEKGNEINLDLNGIKVSTYIKQDLDKNQNTIEIINKNIENINLFKAFSATLIENLNESDSQDKSFKILQKTITDYQNYFAGNLKNNLSKQEQQGLFGELSFILEKVNQQDYTVISHWEGVMKNKHDFVYEGYSYEIKTTRNQQRLDIRISNEHQLDNSKVSELYLVVYRLEEVNIGRSIADLYNEICLKLPVQFINLFNSKILQMGIDMKYNEYYKFVVISTHKYLVDEKFPKIINSNLHKALFDIKYKINLDGIGEIVDD